MTVADVRPPRRRLLLDLRAAVIVPLVLIALWLLALETSAAIGLAPAGAVAMSVLSILCCRLAVRRDPANAILAAAVRKILIVSWVFLVVSAVVLAWHLFWIASPPSASRTFGEVAIWFNRLPVNGWLQSFEGAAFYIRAAILLALVVLVLLGSLLAGPLASLSTRVGKALDIGLALLAAILLFGFYGASATGVGAAAALLRDREASAEAVYSQLHADIAAAIVRDVVDQAANADEVLSRPPFVPPASDDDSGVVRPGSPTPPPAAPVTPTPRTYPPGLNNWERLIFDRTVHRDWEQGRAVVERLRPLPSRARDLVLPSQASPAALERVARTLQARAASEPTLVPSFGTAREMLSLAVDLAPDAVAPVLAQLGTETIVAGDSLSEVVGVLGDSAFYEVLNASAAQVLETAVLGGTATAVVESIRSAAKAFSETAIGQRLVSGLRKLRDHARNLATAIVNRSAPGAEAGISRVETAMLDDLGTAVRAVTAFPSSIRSQVPATEIARSNSTVNAILSGLVTATNRGAVANQVADLYGRAVTGGQTANSTTARLNLQEQIYSLGRTLGVVSGELGVCQHLVNGIVVHSYVTTRERCL